jgi:hypothetical protein
MAGDRNDVDRDFSLFGHCVTGAFFQVEQCWHLSSISFVADLPRCAAHLTIVKFTSIVLSLPSFSPAWPGYTFVTCFAQKRRVVCGRKACPIKSGGSLRHPRSLTFYTELASCRQFLIPSPTSRCSGSYVRRTIVVPTS